MTYYASLLQNDDEIYQPYEGWGITMPTAHGPIEAFLDRYVKEYDFYQQAARSTAQIIDARLKTEGIRAIVSSRAKDLKRAEEKCRQRAATKEYRSVDEVYDDIVDLAGVRIALYFPGDQEPVGRLISDLFNVKLVKKFPDTTTPRLDKRFSGYAARHYRVRLGRQAAVEPRYLSANIEIQVASVLMHAWAEVEHDLVYKPDDSAVSRQELMILDELNGLVLAGEIALERLQAAVEERASSKGRQFANHYDLAAYLLGRLAPLADGPLANEGLGRVDLLFDLLVAEDILKPEKLDPYLKDLHADLDRRPLAEQVIDSLLLEKPDRYQTFLQLRTATPSSSEAAVGVAQGAFLNQWIDFERFMNEALDIENGKRRPPTGMQIQKLTVGKPWFTGELQHLRQMRNEIVHGGRRIDIAEIEQARETLAQILHNLKHGEN